MPAAISMLSAKFLNISQSWKPWTFEHISTYFLSHLAQKSLRCSHATASLAVSPVSQHHGIHHCPDRPPLLFNRPGGDDVGPTKVWGTNCASWEMGALSGFKNLDVPWCQEPLAEIELCRHVKSLWSQKKWKSPRTIEIKFRDVYCNRILYIYISITPQVFAGVVLINEIRLCEKSLPPKSNGLSSFFPYWNGHFMGHIHHIHHLPSFSEIPKSVQSQVLMVKTKLMMFCANETLDTFGASSSCRSWNCDLGEV